MAARNASWHALPVEEALRQAGSTEQGISEAEAASRLARYGMNVLRLVKPIPWWTTLASQFTNVFSLLLGSAAALAFFIGIPSDSIAILAVLLLNSSFGFVTEVRARRAIDALRSLEVRRATVVRENHAYETDASKLVPGDVIQLEAGRAVPADARLLASAELSTLDSALTGESVPVLKCGNNTHPAVTPLADRDNMVYQGTIVTGGTGRALIIATGGETEVGRIGALVSGIVPGPTPLERRLASLGRKFAAAGLAVAIAIAVISLLQGNDLSAVIRTAVAVSIAALPESLPAVVTVAMAIGVRRLARRHALIRRIATVESLGSATVVCTDKTGTLTTGEMTVTTLWVGGREISVSGTGYGPEGGFTEGERAISAAGDSNLTTMLRIAALANRGAVYREVDRWQASGDPTDAALLAVASKGGVDRGELLGHWPEVAELPFSSERRLMASYHRTVDGGLLAHVKGSPAAVIRLCDRAVSGSGEDVLDSESRASLLAVNETLASRGLRVLALAYGVVNEASEKQLESLTFVGFTGMLDAPAPGVIETVALLHRAGIRTVMLTGDQRRTAEAIAASLGIMRPGDESIDGSTADALSDSELAQRVGRVVVYSRVSPETKLRIVTALQHSGQIVAMLGDGVNDAPALKAADVGVAMGQRGTDIAREAAGVILENDRFATVATAVEEGRVIFDNIRKFVFYLFSCNIAELGVLLAAGLADLPIPLLPLQILWLNLVTDSFPAVVLAFESAEADVMRRGPRNPREGILDSGMFRSAMGHAALIAICVLLAFVIGLDSPSVDSRRAQTIAFMTLALAQGFHLGNARSRGHVLSRQSMFSNPLAVVALFVVIGLQLLSLYAAPLRQLLELVPLSVGDWAIVLGLSAVPALVGQALKWGRHKESSGHDQ